MKPRNFPGRIARRRARVKFNQDLPLTDDERRMLLEPKDTRIRKGRTARLSTLPNGY